jgi:hypothetical protein
MCSTIPSAYFYGILHLRTSEIAPLPTEHIERRGLHTYGWFCGSRKRSRYTDLLRAGRSGYRIPVGARFSAPLGPTRFMGNGYRVSFRGVRRPGRDVNHPTISTAFMVCSRGTLLLPLYCLYNCLCSTDLRACVCWQSCNCLLRY